MPSNNFNKAWVKSVTGISGDPFIYVDDKRTVIMSSKKVGFITDKENGNVISGKTSIKAEPEEITVNHLWKFNNILMTTLPSTIYTPIPVFKVALTDQMQHMAKVGVTVGAMVAALMAMR